MNNQEHKEKKSKSSSDDIEVGGNVSDSIVIKGDGNTIHVGAKNTSSGISKKRNNHDKPQKTNVGIVVAWIGFFATILTAFITVFGNKIDGFSLGGASGVSPSYTETTTSTSSPVPINTATSVEPASTLVSFTETPMPTFTLVPPVPIGQDWMAGCISSLWNIYPVTQAVQRNDGCWQEPVYAFSAENGDLDFLYERGSGSAEIYGLFAPLPESGTVTFTVRLSDLNNADLWMGVFPEPDLNSRGLLMTVLNGDVNRRAIVQKDISTYETIQGTEALNQGNGYSISFVFTALSATSRVNPAVFVTNQFSMPTTHKWLFLGYKGLRGAYRIEGTFLSFELKP